MRQECATRKGRKEGGRDGPPAREASGGLRMEGGHNKHRFSNSIDRGEDGQVIMTRMNDGSVRESQKFEKREKRVASKMGRGRVGIGITSRERTVQVQCWMASHDVRVIPVAKHHQRKVRSWVRKKNLYQRCAFPPPRPTSLPMYRAYKPVPFS